jgi:hypothetical protein
LVISPSWVGLSGEALETSSGWVILSRNSRDLSRLSHFVEQMLETSPG